MTEDKIDRIARLLGDEGWWDDVKVFDGLMAELKAARAILDECGWEGVQLAGLWQDYKTARKANEDSATQSPS